ncbi:hypothetical protein PUNSTDRAFT_138431 [Punctularia strigosozonata HHB-11173 SS5]|uniref:Uncharacterized protein n=1 Tax=Punctularia strigosozonata (strain HHB-11173) TaxID=741275 RepID=R7S5N7_PUNST|nr:uncharacterized protein PUNSTDRAFT_138431 [Punctularia strigosozonata HHB-11173 SS5]EIN04786.1 hypothetical protein PUNSTDRAFT_138431 [Punctularia strigosozonata HHB-11173 SS5]
MARHSDYSIDSGGLVRASFEPPGAHLVFGPAVAARPTVLRQSKDINTPFPTNFRAFPRQRDHRAVEQETQTGLLVSRFGCPYGGLSSRSSIAQSSDPNVRAGPNYDSRAPRQIVGPTVFVPTYTRPPPSAEWAQPPKRSITPPSPSDELPPPSLAELTSLEYAQAISSFVSDFWKPRPGVQLSDGWEEPPPLPPRIPPRSPLDFSALDALGDRPFSLWGSKTIIYPEEVLFQGPPEVLPYSDPIRQHLEEHVPSYLQMSVETKAVGGIQASESLLPYALDPSHSPLAHEGLEYVSSSMSAKSFDDFAWPTDIRVQRSEHQGLQNLTMQEPSGMPLFKIINMNVESRHPPRHRTSKHPSFYTSTQPPYEIISTFALIRRLLFPQRKIRSGN